MIIIFVMLMKAIRIYEVVVKLLVLLFIDTSSAPFVVRKRLRNAAADRFLIAVPFAEDHVYCKLFEEYDKCDLYEKYVFPEFDTES